MDIYYLINTSSYNAFKGTIDKSEIAIFTRGLTLNYAYLPFQLQEPNLYKVLSCPIGGMKCFPSYLVFRKFKNNPKSIQIWKLNDNKENVYLVIR